MPIGPFVLLPRACIGLGARDLRPSLLRSELSGPAPGSATGLISGPHMVMARHGRGAGAGAGARLFAAGVKIALTGPLRSRNRPPRAPDSTGIERRPARLRRRPILRLGPGVCFMAHD